MDCLHFRIEASALWLGVNFLASRGLIWFFEFKLAETTEAILKILPYRSLLIVCRRILIFNSLLASLVLVSIQTPRIRLDCQLETLHCCIAFEPIYTRVTEQKFWTVLLGFSIEGSKNISKDRTTVYSFDFSSSLVPFTFFFERAPQVTISGLIHHLKRTKFLRNILMSRFTSFVLKLNLFPFIAIDRLILIIIFDKSIMFEDPVFMILLCRINKFVQVGRVEDFAIIAKIFTFSNGF